MSGVSEDLRERATDMFHVDMDVSVTKIIYYLRSKFDNGSTRERPRSGEPQ